MGSRLQGKVVLVTGSTRGIGRAVAEVCAEEGAQVVVTGRSEQDGHDVVRSISAAGGEATFIRMDATKGGDVQAAVEHATEQYGGLHALVVNAGTAQETSATFGGVITEITLEGWRKTVDDELLMAFLPLKYGVRAMVDGHGGSVLLMSSIVGRRGVNGSDGYTAAKSALIGLSRSIASYYGRYDIRCNSLAIGIIAEGSTKKHLENPQFAQEAHRLGLGKVGTAREVALAALFFVSDDSTFVSGEVLSVDGGAYAAGHISRPDRPDIPGTERKRPLAPPC